MGALCTFGRSPEQVESCGFNNEGFREKDGALLAGAEAAAFTSVNIPANVGKSEHQLKCDFDSFVKGTPEVESQAFNLIKKCPNCGKPNATTMDSCNACGTDLKSVEIAKSPNIFMTFIFGVEKLGASGPPMKISIRTETPTMIVFDDPLAITRAHVLAVPTDLYCPDIRSLFTAPAKGIQLLQKMEQAAWEALEQGPLANQAWCQKTLSPTGNAIARRDLRERVVAAFNLPPSQYQLHLQYMLPPLLPGHYGIFKKGAHFKHGRHFPLSFVLAALEAFAKANQTLPNAPDMKTEDFIKAIEEKGIMYDAAHKDDMAKLAAANTLLGNWQASDFAYAIADGKVVDKSTGDLRPASPEAKDVDNQDKLALQGYGRPYVDGKPGGVCYSYPRKPGALPLINS